MHTASMKLPLVGKSYRTSRLAPRAYGNLQTIDPPVDRERASTDRGDARLPDLLQLVGQGIGGREAYLILPPQNGGTAVTPGSVRGWTRIEWHAEKDRAVRLQDYVLPRELREVLVNERTPVSDSRGSVHFFDDRCEAVVFVCGPRSQFLGILGIAYPAESRPEVGRIRLLQDIVANQLADLSLPRRTSRLDLQRRVDARSLPALFVSEHSIACVNEAAEFMLAGSSSESLLGHRLDDFVPAADCELVLDHIHAIVEGARERRFDCTIVGFDGRERRVEMRCRRYVWRGSVSVEVILNELARYRSYPDPLIETLSEAVWHIRLNTAVPTSAPTSSQVQLIRKHGSLVEANRSFANILGADSLERLLGRRVSSLLSPNVTELITAFVESGYNLRGYELSLRDANDVVRSFLVNATGTIESGRLTDVWGSCSELSDRVELERRSVNLQEEQKERIGRDLHDSVAPLLTGMRLLSGDIMQSNGMEADSLKGKIEKIASFAEQATDRLGEIYRGLVPRVLEEKTLAEALELLVENVDNLPDVSIRFVRKSDADVLRKEDKIQLYRIVQEAVNNAVKHACAGSIQISLEKKSGRIVLCVSDDGQGFDVDVKKTDSLGLQNMRLRANTIGASFSIESAPKEGTAVSVSLSAAQTN